MFLEKSIDYINLSYAQRKAMLPDYMLHIDYKIKAENEKMQIALKYLYAYMPTSDVVNYSFDIYRDYAAHSIYIYENVPGVSDLSDEMFLQYVLYHRVNDEEIRPCRSLFYESLNKFTGIRRGLERVQAVNLWCYREIAYENTDDRTSSALALYKRGKGRCGEESVFAVQAFRSIGIPARQVYAPLWSHCNDNHAWVEVFLDGKWQFTGAGEPAPILNQGWFNSAASKAMMVHSKCFSEPMEEESIIDKEGMVTILNQLKRYAPAKTVVVAVTDKNGLPLSGVKVCFSVLNFSNFRPIAYALTDDSGTAALHTGSGTLHISAFYNGNYNEQIFHSEKEDFTTLRIEENLNRLENKFFNDTFTAPAACEVNKEKPEKEAVEELNKKLSSLAVTREEKISSFKNDDLERFKEDYRKNPVAMELLNVLSEKDLTDVTYDILKEHSTYAAVYEKDMDFRLFADYVLNPRIENEVLSNYREYILIYFTRNQLLEFQQDPHKLHVWINENISEEDMFSWDRLNLLPASVLKSGKGSEKDKNLLTVAVLRTIGIPARLNERTGYPEYFHEKGFIPVSRNINICRLIINKEDGFDPVYEENWSLSKIDSKGNSCPVNLKNTEWKGNSFQTELETGIYRLVTSTRLADGSEKFYSNIINLTEGHAKSILLSWHKPEEK